MKAKKVNIIIVLAKPNFKLYTFDVAELMTEFNSIVYENMKLSKYPEIVNELFNEIIALNIYKYFYYPDDVTENNLFSQLVIMIVICLNNAVGPYLEILKYGSENENILKNETILTRSGKVGTYDQPINNIEAAGFLNNKVSQEVTDTQKDISLKNIKDIKIYLKLKENFF